jgi:ribonucleoside-triphosphate reductase
MCLNAKWLGKDLTHKESQDFVERMLNHMRERLSDYQEKYAPELFNLEATPAESTAYRFAKHDLSRFPDIHTANDHGTPYYTNSTNLPVGTTDDVFEALDVQDHFQPLYTSGTVFHTFLGEKLPDWRSAAKLVKTITDTYKLPYVSISPTYSVCPDHGYIAGEHLTCPVCGKEAEVYSRITGYYRPVKNWNDGKSQEFRDRKVYDAAVSASAWAARGQKAGSEDHGVSKDPSTKADLPEERKKDSTRPTPILVTTKTCPKCRVIRNYMDENGIDYRVVVAGEKEADRLISQFHITSAPTLIGTNGEGLEAYTDIPAIRAYLESAILPHGKAV